MILNYNPPMAIPPVNDTPPTPRPRSVISLLCVLLVLVLVGVLLTYLFVRYRRKRVKHKGSTSAGRGGGGGGGVDIGMTQYLNAGIAPPPPPSMQHRRPDLLHDEGHCNDAYEPPERYDLEDIAYRQVSVCVCYVYTDRSVCVCYIYTYSNSLYRKMYIRHGGHLYR